MHDPCLAQLSGRAGSTDRRRCFHHSLTHTIRKELVRRDVRIIEGWDEKSNLTIFPDPMEGDILGKRALLVSVS